MEYDPNLEPDVDFYKVDPEKQLTGEAGRLIDDELHGNGAGSSRGRDLIGARLRPHGGSRTGSSGVSGYRRNGQALQSRVPL